LFIVREICYVRRLDLATVSTLTYDAGMKPGLVRDQEVARFSKRLHRRAIVFLSLGIVLSPILARAQTSSTNQTVSSATTKSDVAVEKKATDWVASLNLGDAAKEGRVKEVIATHLKAVRDWHNEHSFTSVPAGINPATGRALNELDRQMIADSAIPKTVHQNLMAGLRKDLSAEQVETILDKYTVGKVVFTLNGYHAIVPDLTQEEENAILGFLKQACEEAVDYKNMNEISGVFEIYKTKSEQYLISKGRNWRALYKAYTDAAKARKAAAQGTNNPAR
jgi:hypothetical protein